MDLFRLGTFRKKEKKRKDKGDRRTRSVSAGSRSSSTRSKSRERPDARKDLEVQALIHQSDPILPDPTPPEPFRDVPPEPGLESRSLKSNTNTTNSSVNLINLLPKIPIDTLQSILDRENFKCLLSSGDVQLTLHNPLGNLFFQNYLTARMAADSDYEPQDKDIIKFCQQFADYTRTQKIELKNEMREEAERLIEQNQQAKIARHFDSYSTTCGIKPPTIFARSATLLTDQKIKSANGSFPIKAPFKGEGRPYVHEFLQELNTAQRLINLSRLEFQDFMKRCSSGDAYQTISQSFETGLSIEQVYQSLLMAYDNQISPQAANMKLLNFRATRDQNFSQVTHVIQNLAARASLIYPEGDEKNSAFNIDASAALKRSLPAHSKTLATEQAAALMYDLGRIPKYHELTATLFKYVDSLDNDLRQNGRPKGSNGDTSLYRGKGNSDPTPEDRPPGQPNQSGQNGNGNRNRFQGNRQDRNDRNGQNGRSQRVQVAQPRTNRNQRVNQVNSGGNQHTAPQGNHRANNNNQNRYNSNSNGNNRYSNQNRRQYNNRNGNQANPEHSVPLGDGKFCGHCGQFNHNASDNCRLLRDDDGRMIRQGLASGYCDHCKRKFNLELHHPPNLCPDRPAMHELYRQKRVYPAGVFKESFLKSERERNPQNNHVDSTEYSPRGRVNMIQVTSIPENPSILLVDNRNVPLLTKKIYLTCTASRIHKPGSYPMTGLLDSGSDQNLISRSYLGMALKLPLYLYYEDVESYLDTPSVTLSSYTNHQIPLSGEIELLIGLQENGGYYPMKFLVVDDLIDSATPMIFGLPAMITFNLNVEYRSIQGATIPYLRLGNSADSDLKSHYLTDYELSLCTSTGIDLEPDETRFILMEVDHSFGIFDEMEAIISEDHLPSNQNGTIRLYPTKSRMERDPDSGRLCAQVLAHNIGSAPISNFVITGFCDNANRYNVRDYDCEAPETERMFLHEVKILPQQTPVIPYANPTSPPVRVNEISLNNYAFPIISKQLTIPAKQSLIEKVFPENCSYRANPAAINNDVPVPGKSLTDYRSNIDGILEEAEEQDLEAFLDREQTIQLGLNHISEEVDLLKIAEEPCGYSVPEDPFLRPQDIIKEENYPKEHWPYIKDIFLDSYPDIVSTHSTQRGNISKYLGNYVIRLKPGTVLPKYRKLYYLSHMEKLQMQSILEFLLKNGTIEKSPTSGAEPGVDHYASPAYLIPKSDTTACPRLIVNYKQINSVLESEPPSLPNCDVLVHSLRNNYLYTSTDLSNAFNSLTLDPSCRDLTTFLTPLGKFRMNSLPTGYQGSPGVLDNFMDLMINYELKEDEEKQVIFNSDGVAEMDYAPVEGVNYIADDLIMGSKAFETYQGSVHQHFGKVKIVMGRLSKHGAKISLKKSQLCKTRVNFFGMYITHNFVCVDPKRLTKLKNAPMPTTPKQVRAFLGLVNSMRTHLNFDVLKHTEALTPLTSCKGNKPFTPTEEQRKAHRNLIEALGSGPCSTKMVDLNAPKIVLTDSTGSDQGSFAGMLAQIVRPEKDTNVLAPGLNFSDETHQIIYDHKLAIRPLPLRQKGEDIKSYSKRIKEDLPPEHLYLEDPLLGYSQQEVDNSLGICLQTLLDVTNCQTPLVEICKKASKHIRSTILRHQYIQFVCEDSRERFDQFIKDLEQGVLHIDRCQYIFAALAAAMYRPVIVITAVDGQKQITEHSEDKTKPPFVFTLYEREGKLITHSAMISKQNSYDLKNFRGCFEIIAYISKRISPTLSSLHIIDLELMGIIYALSSFQKLIGRYSQVILLSDAKCLYYLFSEQASDASAKLTRWAHKIESSYPNLRVTYLRGEDNLADYLSRAHNADLVNADKIALPRYVKDGLDDVLPAYTEFTIEEWKQFVANNPGYLGYMDKPAQPKVTVKTLVAEFKAIGTVLTPLEILRNRIAIDIVIKEQKEAFADIYRKCLESPTQEHREKGLLYYVKNAIMFGEIDGEGKIIIPDNLLPIFVSYTHLLCLHGGEKRLLLNLQNFYHPALKKTVRNFVRSCYGCQMHNSPTKLEKYGMYDTIKRPFQTVALDYVQSLPPYRKYNHILTITDQLTGTILMIPCKTLTSREFLNHYMFQVHPLYRPENILADNGSAFMDRQNLQYFAAINVRMIYSSAYNSKAHGLCEAANKSLKYSLIKFLTKYPRTNWVYVLPLICRLHNTTKLNKHGYSPLELLFGTESDLSKDHFGLLNEHHYHHLIRNDHSRIKTLNKDLTAKLQDAEGQLTEERENRINALNKTRHSKNLQEDDLVLVRDKSKPVGVNPSLKPHFLYTPHRIIKASPTTSVVEQIVNKNIQKLSNNDIKKYKEMDPIFLSLPPEILNIVRKPYSDLTDAEIALIAEKDDLPLPLPRTDREIQQDVSPLPSPDRIKKTLPLLPDPSDTESDTSEEDTGKARPLQAAPTKKRIRKARFHHTVK